MAKGSLIDSEARSDTYTVLTRILLTTPGIEGLKASSDTGELGQLIPEWIRLTGSRNIQHNKHHFPLDLHTFKVVERTKASPYFQKLSSEQQAVTALSALLHDIDKNTGPQRLRDTIPVDKLHPIKSAQMSRRILSRLAVPPEVIQSVYTLIHHHQAFGRLFIMFPEGAEESWLRKIALKLRSEPLLECLLALSEGDIRGVQEDDAYFTPLVEAQLAEYGQRVNAMIHDVHQGIPLLPQGLVRDDSSQAIDLGRSGGFLIPAETAEALQGILEAFLQGGAVKAQYSYPLSPEKLSKAPYTIVFRFLPENLAYWGPDVSLESSFPEPWQVPMDLFYTLLGDSPFSSQHAGDAIRICTEAHRFKIGLSAVLEDEAARGGGLDWARVFESHLRQCFGGDVKHTPDLQQNYQRIQAAFPNGDEWIGIGTRPVAMGVYHQSGQWSHLEQFTD